MDSSACQASTHHENIHHSHPTMVLRTCGVFHHLLLCPFPEYSCAWLNETRACPSTLCQPTQPQHTNSTISHSRLEGSSTIFATRSRKSLPNIPWNEALCAPSVL